MGRDNPAKTGEFITLNLTQVMEELFPQTVMGNREQTDKDNLLTLRSEIHNEYCLDTMARMKDNYIDFILTSPPYGEIRKYHGYSFEFEKVAKEMYRVLKEGSVLVWVVGDQTKNGSESGQSFKQALYFKDVVGFKLYDTMIYEKINYTPLTHKRYEQEFEYMFVLLKGDKLKNFNPIMVDCKPDRTKKTMTQTYYKQSDNDALVAKEVRGNITKIKGNIWRYLVGSFGSDKTNHRGHPAVFPEQLAEDHILSWTNKGDLVYDPFMGSGTTGLLAKAFNRHFIGSEISGKYCELAMKRLNL